MWIANNADKNSLRKVLNEFDPETYNNKPEIVTPEKARSEFARLKAFMSGKK